MPKFYNTSRGPVSFVSRNNKVLSVAPKSWLEVAESETGSDSLVQLLRRGTLVAAPPPAAPAAPKAEPKKAPPTPVAPAPAPAPVAPPAPPAPAPAPAPAPSPVPVVAPTPAPAPKTEAAPAPVAVEKQIEELSDAELEAATEPSDAVDSLSTQQDDKA